MAGGRSGRSLSGGAFSCGTPAMESGSPASGSELPGLLRKALDEHRQIGRLFYFVWSLRNPAKAVGGMNKGNSGILAGFEISLGIPDIDGGIQTITMGEDADIFCLGLACITRTQMAAEEGSSFCIFQKNLDISCLAVADDE